MPHFKLVVQKPKPKQLGLGSLSISKNGDADFFEGDAQSNSNILASMVRARIEWAAAAGILISGMENVGVDRTGQIKYRHQEWLLCHIHPNKEI